MASWKPGRDVGAMLAANLANEPLFDIGKPRAVRPAIGIHLDRVVALIVGAVDQDAAYA